MCTTSVAIGKERKTAVPFSKKKNKKNNNNMVKIANVILNENNPKLNSLYIYTFTKNDNIEFDREYLETCIYRENNSMRINIFEKHLWKSTPHYDSSDTVKKLINYYFNNNKEKEEEEEELVEIILQDFCNLYKRYKNYQKFLLCECETFTQRKFLLNLVLFMKNKHFENQSTILMIIQLWCRMNISIDVLEKKFIPLAFSNWYENYSFYKDYFCIVVNKDIKNDFYKSFLNLCIQNKSIENINNCMKKVLKKYSLKLLL